jgi:membrane protein implicated in regulation of membrane protease activity
MWGWAAMAIIFLIAELFTTGFFLVCFGVGAAAAALLAYLGVDPFIQVVAFIAVSGVAVLLTRPLTRRLNEQQKNFVGSDRVLEKRAIVLTEINPPLGAGMVRVDAEEWRATSEDGRIIAKDEIVEVLRIEGTRLVVRPSQTDALAEA